MLSIISKPLFFHIYSLTKPPGIQAVYFVRAHPAAGERFCFEVFVSPHVRTITFSITQSSN